MLILYICWEDHIPLSSLQIYTPVCLTSVTKMKERKIFSTINLGVEGTRRCSNIKGWFGSRWLRSQGRNAGGGGRDPRGGVARKRWRWRWHEGTAAPPTQGSGTTRCPGGVAGFQTSPWLSSRPARTCDTFSCQAGQQKWLKKCMGANIQ